MASSFRDELLKAKLITDKQLRKTDHEERVKKKQLGEKGLEEEKRQKKEILEALEKAKKAKQQELEKKRKEEKELEEANYRIREIILKNYIREGVKGNRKFYFITKEGKIPFLEVTEEIGKKLENGDLAIVEVPFEKYEEFVIVPKNVAKEVLNSNPKLLRFFNS